MRTHTLRDALAFLCFFWGLVLVIGGAIATAGLVLWPWSSQPLYTALVGLAGASTSLLGAVMVMRA
jgi:hypothetical protein